MNDTHAYIFKDCEAGNPVSAREVGGNIPLVIVDLSQQPKSFKCNHHLEVGVWPYSDCFFFLIVTSQFPSKNTDW